MQLYISRTCLFRASRFHELDFMPLAVNAPAHASFAKWNNHAQFMSDLGCSLSDWTVNIVALLDSQTIRVTEVLRIESHG